LEHGNRINKIFGRICIGEDYDLKKTVINDQTSILFIKCTVRGIIIKEQFVCWPILSNSDFNRIKLRLNFGFLEVTIVFNKTVKCIIFLQGIASSNTNLGTALHDLDSNSIALNLIGFGFVLGFSYYQVGLVNVILNLTIPLSVELSDAICKLVEFVRYGSCRKVVVAAPKRGNFYVYFTGKVLFLSNFRSH